MPRGFSVLLAIVCCIIFMNCAMADEFTVGEKWVYKHVGSRSSGSIGQPVNGDRTREILSTTKEKGETRWILSEKWGADDSATSKMFICAKRLIHQVDAGPQMLEFTPPVKLDYMDLKPGEEKNYKSEISDNGKSYHFNWNVKCINKETIEVPAGKFKDCVKVDATVTVSIPPEFSIVMKYLYWYHPDVNGFVKEEFRFSPPGQDPNRTKSFKGVSTLKSHTNEKKK